VPPTRCRSTTATFIPAPVRRNAKDGPACPVPMMIASKSGTTSFSSSRSRYHRNQRFQPRQRTTATSTWAGCKQINRSPSTGTAIIYLIAGKIDLNLAI
jgi:hypothetical protein